MSLRHWLLPTVSLVIVGGMAWYELAGQRIGPGPLHPAHARAPDLAGGSNCEACHDASARVRAEGCLDCHQAIHAQLDAGRGLHGTMPAPRASDCAECHREHHGTATPLILGGAFAAVGILDPQSYDHAHVAAFSLTGAHTGLSCTRCHPHAEAVEPPAGGRFVGLSQDCTSCHEDTHAGGFGNDCGKCHGQELSFDEAPGFLHETFALTGRHGQVACVECHGEGTAHSIAADGRARTKVRECRACHATPHEAQRQPEQALRQPDEPIAAGRTAPPTALPDAPQFGSSGDCARCHDDLGWTPHHLAGTDHASFGFALRGAHLVADCQTCHPTPGHAARYTTPAPPPEACARCHDDPHQGATPTALLLHDTADCARCHDESAWAAARTTPAQHEAFGFALRGAHETTDCVACHGDASHAPRHGAPAPELAECAACHEHAHATEFVAAAAALTGPAAGCADCHRDVDTTFRSSRTTTAQHAATGFPLAVPHQDIACDTCHTGETRAERFPGRLAADCRACHEDVHEGQFTDTLAAGRPRQCTECHLVDAFVPHRFDIEDHAETGFPLTGAHDAVACNRCHDKLRDGVRTFHGTPRACSECHTDVHRGVFDRGRAPRVVDGREGCARCHDTAAFSPVLTRSFDHAFWADWAIDGRHEGLRCVACHPPAAGPAGARDGDGFGPAKGRDCAACHVDIHQGQFRAVGKTDCASCHVTADFHQLTFDHARDSSFPLDDRHRDVACASCHRSYPSAAGPVVRYRPLGKECADCHKVSPGQAGKEQP